MNVTQKILQNHLVGAAQLPPAGEPLSLRIDQTLTQDSTGTMAYLQLEALEVGETQAELSVAYIDHNMLQAGFESADDHLYIQSVAQKHQIWLSKPGNGICHQVHLERFSAPGKTPDWLRQPYPDLWWFGHAGDWRGGGKMWQWRWGAIPTRSICRLLSV